MNNYNQTQVGVGGWLRLLIVILCIVTPFFSVGSLTTDLHSIERSSPELMNDPNWADAKTILWASVALRVCALFFAGWRLSAVFLRSSVRLTIWTLWLAGPITISVTNLIVTAHLGTPALESPVPLGPSTGFALTWSLYLFMSGRVAATYLPSTANKKAERRNPKRRLSISGLTTRQRQSLFAAVLWPICVLLFGLLLDRRYDGFFRNGSTLDAGRLLAWALIPPLIVYPARWFYRRFVTVTDLPSADSH